MSKQQRVVLITGGSSGIGAAICQAFVAEGDQVVLAQRRQIDADGVHSIAADLSDAAQCQALIESTINQFSRLDVLINNAGMMKESPVSETSLEDWHDTLALNLTAPFVLTKYAFPHLAESKGNIINISSVESLGSNPQHAAYCASKAGLNGLTRATAIDGGPQGIRCNAIAPGWIDTPLNEAFIESQPNPEQFRQNLASIHPSGRTGAPVDVAQLALWLASPQADFVTGQVWTVDGGRMSKLSLP